ncbi:MAG: hypothetical protein ACYC1L_04570 [Alphaproteobacteria bacterium]
MAEAAALQPAALVPLLSKPRGVGHPWVLSVGFANAIRQLGLFFAVIQVPAP